MRDVYDAIKTMFLVEERAANLAGEVAAQADPQLVDRSTPHFSSSVKTNAP